MFTNFGSNGGSLETALIGLAVIIFFIVRQFSTRRVLNWLWLLVPLALLYFGVQDLAQLDSTGWLVLTGGVIVGIALGVVRGATFRVWVDVNGQALMRGTALTLVLWIATFAVKFAISIAEIKVGLGSVTASTAETMLPAAATLVAQTLVVYLRSLVPLRSARPGQDQRLLGSRMS